MSDTTIPTEWLKAKLPAVADLNMGQSPSSADVNETGDGLAFFQGKAEFGKLFPTVKKYCSAPKKVAQENDILLSIRAPVGPTNLADRETAIGRGLAAISVSKDYFNYKYLLHYFRNIEPWMSEQGTGTTFKAISGQFLRELECIVPPLAEQNEIADRLDKLLAQVEATQARLARIPDIIKRFRQSVLSAAMNGKLTETWRQYNECISDDLVSEIKMARFKLWKEWQLDEFFAKGKTPKGHWESKYSEPVRNISIENLPVSWSCLSWNEISTWITYGFTKPMPHVDSGPLIITAKNVRDGVVEFDNVHRTTIEAFSSLRPKDKPTVGDILIVKDGATTGRASIAPATLEEYCISQSVAVVWLKYCPINRKFLLWNVQSQETQKKIKEVMAGMAMPHLSITDFGRMLVPIPPSDEIEEIVRRVEQLFAYADTLEQQAKAAKARVDKLTQAILAKAFRGELTADWRAANPDLISGDNSAAALLARIQAERATASGKKGKRGASKSRTTA